MRFLGAKVVLTPASARAVGMVVKTVELAEKHGWFYTRQFENEANADMHSRTTAKEILDDFKGERLDYWVTGFGTGGTLKGVARVLAKERPETKIVVCEPDDAPMLSSGVEQQRNADGSASAGHPSWKPHPMQGWSPDFIAKLAGDAVDMKVISQVLRIANADAMKCSKELAQQGRDLCGDFVGRNVCGSAERGCGGSQGIDDSLHVAGHGGAVFEHSAVCGRDRGHDRGRAGDFALYAWLLDAGGAIEHALGRRVARASSACMPQFGCPRSECSDLGQAVVCNQCNAGQQPDGPALIFSLVAARAAAVHERPHDRRAKAHRSCRAGLRLQDLTCAHSRGRGKR